VHCGSKWCDWNTKPTSRRRTAARELERKVEAGLSELAMAKTRFKVRFDPDMVLERITTAPSTFCLHARNPDHDLTVGGPTMAFGSVASAPNVSDMDGGRRVGNRADYQNLLKLCQHFNIVHFLAGYPVEPIDLHASVRHLEATFDALTLCDKALHAYSLGRQRNLDCLELVRIARQVDAETLEREPSIFTVILAVSVMSAVTTFGGR